jgi:hypothetical protein
MCKGGSDSRRRGEGKGVIEEEAGGIHHMQAVGMSIGGEGEGGRGKPHVLNVLDATGGELESCPRLERVNLFLLCVKVSPVFSSRSSRPPSSKTSIVIC